MLSFVSCKTPAPKVPVTREAAESDSLLAALYVAQRMSGSDPWLVEKIVMGFVAGDRCAEAKHID